MKQIASRSVSARFSAAARTYQRVARAQARTARELAALIPGTPAPRCILDAGCGTGILTARLAGRFRRAGIVAVDIAPGAIAMAQRRFARQRRIDFRLADFVTERFGERFDLVASSSAFQWIPSHSALFRNLRHNMAQGGRLCFAVMVRGTLEELRSARLRAAPGKPPRADLPVPAKILKAVEKCGFTVTRSYVRRMKVRYPSARAFLRAIHDAGVTGGAYSMSARSGGKQKRSVPLNRKELADLERIYGLSFRSHAGVYATYVVLFVIARCRE